MPCTERAQNIRSFEKEHREPTLQEQFGSLVATRNRPAIRNLETQWSNWGTGVCTGCAFDNGTSLLCLPLKISPLSEVLIASSISKLLKAPMRMWCSESPIFASHARQRLLSSFASLDHCWLKRSHSASVW
jgi:hypothetical protein